MANRQAARLLPGHRIRRKGGGATLVVERIEHAAIRGEAVTVHAGGCVFRSWEIERADLLPSSPRGGGEECD
jgi:hypothetical protein